MKKKLIILAMCAALALTAVACSAAEEPKDNTPAPPATEDAADKEEPAQPEQTPEPGENTDKTEAQGVAYENEEFGFKTVLPPVMADSMETETTTRDFNGETITTLILYYIGESDRYNVLSFDIMSEAAWEAVQAEEGPHGTYMGTSEAGQAVVMNTMQSNPAKEGSADAEKVDQFQENLGLVTENFAFTPAAE